MNNLSYGLLENRQAEAYESLNIGLWVSWVYDKEIFNGWITETGRNWAEAYEVNLNKTISVPKQLLWISDKPLLAPEDLKDLLQIAISTNDKEWENEILNELNLWRDVDDFLG